MPTRLNNDKISDVSPTDACNNFGYHFPKMQHFQRVQSFPNHLTIKQILRQIHKMVKHTQAI